MGCDITTIRQMAKNTLQDLTEEQRNWIDLNKNHYIWSKQETEFFEAVLMNGCYGYTTKKELNKLADFFRSWRAEH